MAPFVQLVRRRIRMLPVCFLAEKDRDAFFGRELIEGSSLRKSTTVRRVRGLLRSSPVSAGYIDVGTRLLVDTQIRTAAGTFFRAAEEAGIRAAPIKGLAVSAALYDDPLERSFGDVDVLVSPGDLRGVMQLARRRGFELVFDSKQLGCVNVVVPPGIPFDVRASIGPPAFAADSASDVLERATRRHDPRVCDAPVSWLHEYDHLSLLIVDAVMDKLVEEITAARRSPTCA